MAFVPSEEEREADDMRLRIQSFAGKKTDKGVDKGLITKEEADKLFKCIDKLLYKFDDDWWIHRKGHKSYETMSIMLTEMNLQAELEILQKIEKA